MPDKMQNHPIGSAAQIQQAIKRAGDQLGLQINIKDIKLEHPALEDHGDYSTNVAMVLSRSNFNQSKSDKKTERLEIGQNKSPKNLAEDIVALLKKDQQLLQIVQENIAVAGPGFINFFLKPEYLLSEAHRITKAGEDYGKNELHQGKKAIIEYSSPNIAKPFTIGHLRSTIIGDAVANLLEAVGYTVYRDNHLGDWGTQFGKQIYAIKKWGDIDKIEKSPNPVKELVALYVKFHQEAEADPSLNDQGREWFKKLEDGDQEARQLWQKCIDWSWKEFTKIYGELNIDLERFENHGRGYGESYFEDKMEPVIEELKEKSLLTESEGAQIVKFPNDEYPPLMIIKQDGATLYSTRDLATDKFRLQKYGQDVLIINEVGVEQSLYFQQLFKLEEMLGWLRPGQRIHIAHGHYRFSDKKMSTRKGDVIWLEEVIRDAQKRAYKLASSSGENRQKWIAGAGEMNEEEIFDLAFEKHTKLLSNKKFNEVNSIAIGALKYNDLRRTPSMDITFDWDELLNMQGNSGPYLQYTYARCQSVLEKADPTLSPSPQRGGTTPSLEEGEMGEVNSEELAILRVLYKFPEVVLLAATDYTPNHICTYLHELAQRYNTFYNQHSILNADNQQQKNFRLMLTFAAAQVLENGLKLLGIESPQRM